MHSHDTIPYGKCHCGCDETTNIYRDRHNRYIAGHQRRKSPVEYIIDPETGCHNWQRTCDALGYGNITVKGVRKKAYRYRYEQEKGPIPKGHDLDHLCRNPACVNPDHLEPVLPAINLRRGKRTVLTDDDVIEIRSLYPSVSQNKLAAKFGVSRRCIRSVINGTSWREPKPRRPLSPTGDMQPEKY